MKMEVNKWLEAEATMWHQCSRIVGPKVGIETLGSSMKKPQTKNIGILYGGSWMKGGSGKKTLRWWEKQ